MAKSPLFLRLVEALIHSPCGLIVYLILAFLFVGYMVVNAINLS